MIETLDGDFNETFFIYENSFFGSRVSVNDGEPIAQPAFSWENTMLDAKAPDTVRIAWVTDLAQQLGATPMVCDLPTDQEKDGNLVEGRFTPGLRSTQTD